MRWLPRPRRHDAPPLRERVEPTLAQVAAGMLAGYGLLITAAFASEEERVMDAAGFTAAEREAFRTACDIPADQYTPEQTGLLLRYEDAREWLS
jgi:hypothetical protein